MEDRYIVTIRDLATGEASVYEPLTLAAAMEMVDTYLAETRDFVHVKPKITLEKASVIGEWTAGIRTT